MATGTIKMDKGVNNYGNKVDLASYNSASNKYTFPSDGYVTMNSTTTSTGKLSGALWSADDKYVASMSSTISGAYHADSWFVRKGMKCYVALSGSMIAEFYPLSD